MSAPPQQVFSSVISGSSGQGSSPNEPIDERNKYAFFRPAHVHPYLSLVYPSESLSRLEWLATRRSAKQVWWSNTSREASMKTTSRRWVGILNAISLTPELEYNYATITNKKSWLQASTLWKRPFQCGGRSSLSQYGISVVNESL